MSAFISDLFLFRLKAIKYLLLVVFVLLQVSCGFNSPYKKGSRAEEFLAAIEINPVKTIEGVDFYNNIKSLFPSERNTLYVLNTTLSFSRSYNILQSNSDILREVQNVTVTYEVIDKTSLKLLTKGSFVKMDSYNVDSLLYSNAVLRQAAISQLAENAAEEIRNRLIMFFEKK